MTSVRGFVETDGAAALGAVRSDIHKAVYDERFACARAFAAEAERRGWAVSAIRGDVTELWREDLSLLWREEAASVTGMTEDNALFCLERLAWDAGLRVVCRRREAEGGLVSWTIARA